MESDADLLQCFVATGSNPAFAALVQRHLPLVYATACRRLNGDTHRAQDVAQLVFTLLARKAGSLRRHPSITGWLHTTTHHLATKTMRSELRRTARENTAEALRRQTGDDVAWESLRPVIDDALHDLPETERLAVLLRFFQNETFAAIGARLGLSESSARGRTDRALERLQAGLSRRGVTSTGAALGTALAAQATFAAPAGLASAIAANAAVGATGTLLFMSTSTLKFGALSATLLAGAAGLFWQNQTNTRLRDENAALITELGNVRRTAQANERKSILVARELTAAQEELARSRTAAVAPESASNTAVVAWTARVANLRQRIASQPEQAIPELRFLSEDDWLDAARQPLETEVDYRKALAKLRNTAEQSFGNKYLQPALRRFAQNNGNAFPGDLTQLQSYFDEPIEGAILDRWTVMPSDGIRGLRLGGTAMVSQKAAVDPDYDTRRAFGNNSMGATGWNNPERPVGAGDGARTSVSTMSFSGGGLGGAAGPGPLSAIMDTIMTQPPPPPKAANGE
jgi:RNA polymerase sigma factor (sigma-70 family)